MKKYEYSKLNLGCGNNIIPEHLNVDFEEFKGVDLILDLNKIPYPFKTKQFEEILMFNILEHLDNPYNVMKEIWRISKPNAKIYLKIPHFSSDNAWGDIQHKRGFSFETFKAPNMSKYFNVLKQEAVFPRFRVLAKLFANSFLKIYERMFAYILPASGLDIILETKK